jgi:hypothetical protein
MPNGGVHGTQCNGLCPTSSSPCLPGHKLPPAETIADMVGGHLHPCLRVSFLPQSPLRSSSSPHVLGIPIVYGHLGGPRHGRAEVGRKMSCNVA